jgi:hypothetical protein
VENNNFFYFLNCHARRTDEGEIKEIEHEEEYNDERIEA